MPATDTEKLIDSFGRHVNYLRISVTDRCNFRCQYCMSEDMVFARRSTLLTLEETLAVARAFCSLGVSKLRITGGEPLVRRNILWLMEQLGRLPQLQELTLTTNGTLLPRYADDLRRAGVSRINISLDSLDHARFRRITRTGELQDVLDGIEAARAASFKHIRLNSVILKHRNHDEVARLTRFALERDMDIAFIEEMPLGSITDHDRADAYYSSDSILADLQREFTLLPSAANSGGPARYFQIENSATRVGFISPHSHNFCDSCNRVRLTAQGLLLLCLGQEHSSDLRRIVRNYPGDTERLKQTIRDAMTIKPHGHDFELQGQPRILRYMNMTGG